VSWVTIRPELGHMTQYIHSISGNSKILMDSLADGKLRLTLAAKKCFECGVALGE
jgi:hypothetical protein